MLISLGIVAATSGVVITPRSAEYCVMSSDVFWGQGLQQGEDAKVLQHQGHAYTLQRLRDHRQFGPFGAEVHALSTHAHRPHL